jgi:Protein of unknown function (DUF2935).
MMNDAITYRIPPRDMVRENSFWLRIFRDHAQFFMDTLVPGQTALIAQSQQFYRVFDQLLGLKRDDAEMYLQDAAQAVMQFRAFKLNMVNMQLTGQIPVNLPPGALNEMLDEDDEYLRILNVVPHKQPMNEAAFLLHQHSLWLPNNAAHAALIQAQLDPGEGTLTAIYRRYGRQFQQLTLKVMEMKGLMRDNPRMTPSLVFTTREIATLTQEFRRSLESYIEQRTTAQVLAISPPLLADHLAREATYYLDKIGYNR